MRSQMGWDVARGAEVSVKMLRLPNGHFVILSKRAAA